ncbi:CheC-like family protein [Moraxella macacae 0408225]|uniref:CheC-like family protein n=1 Tax=Moraxella macacae 0408225 TaxID=1230338 RepID=L2F873_9GAMM|nr:chemotaxis protein CheX [Moraxella macacae]ELA09080.1 CheC-like family protein [Moraxella macacae 0408225]
MNVEKNFQVFIDSVANYFRQLNDEDIAIATPYLNENDTPIVSDYTGVIGITGNNKGLVYFTAPKPLLEKMLLVMQESDNSEDNLIDLVGEVANTISGNARSQFGPEFNISVPFVFRGQPDSINLPKNRHSFVIPLEWKNLTAAIVIYLQNP